LACLRHALHDRLSVQFRLALSPLVVASRRMLGHGPHSAAGNSAARRLGSWKALIEWPPTKR
jgi:hypothetical protein